MTLRSLLLGALLTVAPHAPSLACSPPEGTEEDAFRRAVYVFHALVVETRLNPYVDPAGAAARPSIVDATYELRSTVKGDPPARGTISSGVADVGSCGLPLLAGTEYIFFVQPWPTDGPKDFRTDSLGLVWVSDSIGLTGYPPQTDAALARLRAYEPR